MTREDFDDYVDAFNRRDYDRLHAEYFAPDVKLYTLGYVLDGQAGVRRFYDFFHAYIDEALEVVDYQPRDGGFYGEIRMNLTAKKALTPDVLAQAGFDRLPPIPEGVTYATTLFVDYRVKDGKLHRIRCAEFPDPQEG